MHIQDGRLVQQKKHCNKRVFTATRVILSTHRPMKCPSLSRSVPDVNEVFCVSCVESRRAKGDDSANTMRSAEEGVAAPPSGGMGTTAAASAVAPELPLRGTQEFQDRLEAQATLMTHPTFSAADT